MTPNRDPFRIVPALSVVVLAWLALFPISSVDAYYHLAVGHRILAERSIPARGVGSATLGQAPWHDNEWGFQVVAAIVGRTSRDPDGVLVLTPAGRRGLVLLRALCLAATLALLSAQMARSGVHALARAVAVWVAAFLTFGNLFWDVRPQILSYLAFAAVSYLLERDRLGTRWAAPAILAVIALWANVHGAFITGVALIGAEAAGDLTDGIFSRLGGDSRSRGLRLAVLTALAPLAACLNPHGWSQVVHPFLYMLHPEIHAANAEWERPDLLHLPLLVLTTLAMIAGLVANGRPRIAEALRLAAFSLLFSTAIRHLPLVALVFVPIATAHLVGASRRGGWRRHLDPTGSRWGPSWQRGLAATGLAIAVVVLSGAKFVSLRPRFEERTSRPMPERSVRFLARERVEGNGLNEYRFGGFLMFRMYPAERVFMDGRNDLYGAFRSDVFDRILFTQAGWRPIWDDAVRRYDVGWVLVDEKEPIVDALRGDPEWLTGPGGAVPVVVERPGEEGIAVLLRNTESNRERLPRLLALARGGA